MLSSLKINGLQLMGVAGFAVDGVDGLDDPSRRITSYDRPGDDGGRVSASLYGSRPVTIRGRVSGAGAAATHEANRQLLQAACAETRDSNGYPTPALIELTTLSGRMLFFNAVVTKVANPVGRTTTFSPFMVSLIAPDHRMYLTTQQTTGLISRPSGGGFLLPVVFPIVSTSNSGGSANAINAGTIPTVPTLTFRGPLTTPYLLNGAAGKYMQLNTTLGGSDVVAINMAERTIMLNGSTPLLTAKSTDSDWWSLLVGNNLLAFNTTASGDLGTAEVTWYNAVLGV